MCSSTVVVVKDSGLRVVIDCINISITPQIKMEKMRKEDFIIEHISNDGFIRRGWASFYEDKKNKYICPECLAKMRMAVRS